MGKITGFMEIDRQERNYLPASDRIRNFREFTLPLSEEALRGQAARCMDCGIPYCHSGCPVHNQIPDWNDLVYREDWRTAARDLHSTNNFPEFTGRICPAPCEAACTLNIEDNPVTIKTIECAIADKAWDEGWVAPEIPQTRLGKRVAVIGSGPAGLACAQQLARAGYEVHVFEKNAAPGGLLRYGIPDFKLEKHHIDRRIEQMRAEGVTFHCNHHIGGVPAPNGDAASLASAVHGGIEETSAGGNASSHISPSDDGASSGTPPHEAAAQNSPTHPPTPAEGMPPHPLHTAPSGSGGAPFTPATPEGNLSTDEGGASSSPDVATSPGQKGAPPHPPTPAGGVPPHPLHTAPSGSGGAPFTPATPEGNLPTSEAGASFVQRPPKDSEKGRVGGQKTWGVWGVSPHMGGKAPHMQEATGGQPVGGAGNTPQKIPATELQKNFDAIVLAGGSETPRDLPVPGRHTDGVHFAMDFLTQQNKRIRGEAITTEPITAAGKNVVVIGGGDTGSDCIGTSFRQGAVSVTQLEILPPPPDRENKLATWPDWPMKMRTSSSQAEGAERHFAVATRAIETKNGAADALRCVRLDASNNEIPDSDFRLPAQLILLAMGFTHPTHEGMLAELGVALDARGNVATGTTPSEQYATAHDGIFAAGDMRRGQSLVVWAIREGRAAARAVDLHLRGRSDLPA